MLLNVFVSGNEVFSVDPVSGQVSTTSDLDREDKARYSLIVQASDQGDVRRSSTTEVGRHSSL